MAKKLYEESTIQAIADAIRAKNGSDTPAGTAYIKVSATCTDGANAYATKNEELPA